MALTEREKKFVLGVVELDNLTEAYLRAGYRCSRESAAESGARLSRKIRVANAIEEARRERLKRLEMSADEAMVLLGKRARAEDIDIRRFFGPDGKMLAPSQWPEDIVRAVKGVEAKPWGYKVTLKDGLRALEIIATAGGRIRKGAADGDGFDLAKYLDGAIERVKGREARA